MAPSRFRPRIPWRVKKRLRRLSPKARRKAAQPRLPPPEPEPTGPPPPPTVELWRRDLRLDHVPFSDPPLAAPEADEHLTDAPVEPLAAEAPQYIADRPAFVASIVQGWITAPECYVVTKRHEVVRDTLETRRT